MEINNATDNIEIKTDTQPEIKTDINDEIKADIQPEIKTDKPKKIKVKKTENINAYMANYMKKQYADDPTHRRNYANSISIKKKYVIDDVTWKKYGANLHNVITMTEIIKYMGDAKFEEFLNEYKNLKFEKKE